MEREKYVDESWKEQAELEKNKFSGQSPAQNLKDTNAAPLRQSPSASEHLSVEQRHPEEFDEEEEDQEDQEIEQEESENEDKNDPRVMNFSNYFTSLCIQVMVFMGEIPHPVTRLVQKNLEQAKLLIDTLVMLREKTKGNLTKKEDNLLNSSLYELQMRYVEAVQQELQPKKK